MADRGPDDGDHPGNRRGGVTLRASFGAFVIAVALSACVAEPIAADRSTGAGQVPVEAYQWRGLQTRFARQEMGLNAPAPLLAAQVHQESRWQADAESPVGARGLAQFMPATAGHVGELSGGLGRADILTTPRANLRAQAIYMGWLRARADAREPATEADRWAWVLSGYNGGLGWLDRERHSDAGDPRRWYCDTYHANARSEAAWRENRHYVRTIIEGQERYQNAGWHGPTAPEGEDCGSN